MIRIDESIGAPNSSPCNWKERHGRRDPEGHTYMPRSIMNRVVVLFVVSTCSCFTDVYCDGENQEQQSIDISYQDSVPGRLWQNNHYYTVLTGEEYVFQKASFAFQVEAADAPNGKAVVMIRGGETGLRKLSWVLDYSRLELGKEHTLFGVFRVRRRGKTTEYPDEEPLLIINAETLYGAQLATAGTNLSNPVVESRNGWQTFELLTFKLERDTVLNITITSRSEIQELLADRLFLVSDYPPQSETERLKQFKPLYPNEHYSELFGDFVFSLIYRMKNYFNEDPQSVIERQLYDIRLHHIDVIVATGLPANSPSDDAEKTIESILETAGKLRLGVIVPLKAFFPDTLISKFKATRELDGRTMREVDSIVNTYIPKFSDYNSLIGYVLVDEPYPHQLPLLTAIKRRIEEVDGKHPLVTFAQAPHHVFAYAASQNLMGSGSYPYQKNRNTGIAAVLGNRTLAREMKEEIFDGYFWLCLQGFTRGDDARITRSEYSLQANLQIMGSVDGLTNYVYFPHRYTIAEGGENYCFINSIEAEYSGEYNLWGEVGSIGARLIGLKNILTSLESSSARGIDLEAEEIYVNLQYRPVIDMAVKQLPEVGKFLFLCNIDAKNEHVGRLRFSGELFESAALYDLDLLREVTTDRKVEFEFTLPPGGMAIYTLAEPEEFNLLKRSILRDRLKEEVWIRQLRLRPFLNQSSAFELLHSKLKTMESALSGRGSGELNDEALIELQEELSLIGQVIEKNIDGDIQLTDFLNTLKRLEGNLSQIDDYIKERKIITGKISVKKAEKYNLKKKKEWEMSSPEVTELEENFVEFAKQYLAIKTGLIKGDWKEWSDQLHALHMQVSAVLDSLQRTPVK